MPSDSLSTAPSSVPTSVNETTILGARNNDNDILAVLGAQNDDYVIPHDGAIAGANILLNDVFPSGAAVFVSGVRLGGNFGAIGMPPIAVVRDGTDFPGVVDLTSGAGGGPKNATTGGGFTMYPNGTMTFNPRGEFDYLAPGQYAKVEFLYVATDGNGAESAANVTVTVMWPDATTAVPSSTPSALPTDRPSQSDRPSSVPSLEA